MQKAEKTFDRSGIIKRKWQSPYINAQIKALKLRIAAERKRDKRLVSKALKETINAFDVFDAVPDIDEGPVAALHVAALYFHNKGDQKKVKDIANTIKENDHKLPPVLAEEIKVLLNTFSGNGRKKTARKVKKKLAK